MDNGKKVVLNGLLQYLVRKFGRDSVYYLLIGSRLSDTDAPCQVRTLDNSNVIGRIASVLINSVILRKKSLQESFIYSKKLEQDIFQQIE